MLAFLKLIRTKNLLIIAFTQYMVRWCLLYPILKSKQLSLQLAEINFFLLVLSTVLIAAAGYIINDYFDVGIDRVNKPERMVIDKGIKRRVAMLYHTFFTVIAILIAIYVALRVGPIKLAAVHVLCAAGLWFYSTTFKRKFLIGNILISIFTALVPLIVGVYELIAVREAYTPIYSDLSLREEWTYVLGISFFAFILTWIREIIKDMEDVEGDEKYGCKTMPIVLGIQTSKWITTLLALSTMVFLVYFATIKWSTSYLFSSLYIAILLELPLAYLIFRVLTAKHKKHFRTAGTIAKIIMLFGISYLFVFAQFILSHI